MSETPPPIEEDLPRRPRRRLLTPTSLALLGVLLIACGFIGGVLVEKGQSSPGSGGAAVGAGSFTSRIAALRAGASGTGARSGSTSGTGGTASGSGGAGFTRPTSGQVAYLAGRTLYVTTAEGNTIKVATSPATSVTKSVTTSVKGIHPGETVSITGPASSGGSITAEAISVGSPGGGLAALLGGGGRGERGSGSTSGGGGGAPSLFGSG